MNGVKRLIVRNGQSAGIGDIPIDSVDNFRAFVTTTVKEVGRLVTLFGVPASTGEVRLYAVLANASGASLTICSAEARGHYPSLTPDCVQAGTFERELHEQFGLVPEGHPWLKPVRFDRRGDRVGSARFFEMKGAEVHEVAVGPVHAGIIEPGHFRFQCHGEEVFHLEISLGYQHRGVERAMCGGPDKRSIHYAETLAGDTTIGHATAYCEAIEALADCDVPARAQSLRGVALELERLANHTGDLGALAGDVGYLPTASFCGRLRGDFLNMTALLCGSRFGRGFIRPGGVAFDVDADRAADLLKRLDAAGKDVRTAVDLLWKTPSVQARFEGAGVLTPDICEELGLVGPAARACGVERDVRQEFPSGIYRFFQIPVTTWDTGDVFARAYVRGVEIQRSIAFIEEQLKTMPNGAMNMAMGRLRSHAIVVSLVEGWRGEICHVAMTNEEGKIARYKIVDPSFHNWPGLAMALRRGQISDFPLCNKSFNLSYCGHDL